MDSKSERWEGRRSEESSQKRRLFLAGFLIFLAASFLFVAASFRFGYEPFYPAANSSPDEAALPAGASAVSAPSPANRTAPAEYQNASVVAGAQRGSSWGSVPVAREDRRTYAQPGGAGSGSERPAAKDGSSNDEAGLRSAGGPKDRSEASLLGSTKGLFSDLGRRIMHHPALVRALLNNKYVVDAYMGRDLVRKNCSSPQAMKAYLMDGKSAGGLQEDLPIVYDFLKDRDAALAFGGSRMAKEIFSCPAINSLAQDPGSLQQIAMANPSLVGFITDPTVLGGLNVNPQVMSVFTAANKNLSR